MKSPLTILVALIFFSGCATPYQQRASADHLGYQNAELDEGLHALIYVDNYKSYAKKGWGQRASEICSGENFKAHKYKEKSILLNSYMASTGLILYKQDVKAAISQGYVECNDYAGGQENLTRLLTKQPICWMCTKMIANRI